MAIGFELGGIFLNLVHYLKFASDGVPVDPVRITGQLPPLSIDALCPNWDVAVDVGGFCCGNPAVILHNIMESKSVTN